MKFDACMKLVVNQAPILAFAQTDDWATFQALYIRSHASSQPSRNHPIPTPTNEVPKSHLIIQINRQIFLHSDLRPSSQLGRTMIYPASSSLSPCKSSSTPAARPCLSFPSSPSMQASHWLWGCRTRSWSPGRRTSQHRPGPPLSILAQKKDQADLMPHPIPSLNQLRHLQSLVLLRMLDRRDAEHALDEGRDGGVGGDFEDLEPAVKNVSIHHASARAKLTAAWRGCGRRTDLSGPGTSAPKS